jgi:hypothetical protein
MSSLTDPSTTGQFFEAALRYSRLGFKVLPVHSVVDGLCTCGDTGCSSPGKHPLTRHGCRDATTDETIINEWAEQAPTANVGIATGGSSGTWVLDLDGEEGLATLAQFEGEHGPLPLTMRARTGGGGEHVFFAGPSGGIRCQTAVQGFRIDVRGDGGYVVAPPSCHASGRLYEWLVQPEEHRPAEAPDWLLELVRGRQVGSSAALDHAAGPSLIVLADDLTEAGGVPEGNRRNELCRLVGCHIARGDDAAQVEREAIVWAASCEPPLPDNEVQHAVRDLVARHNGRATPSVVLSGDQVDIDLLDLPDPDRLPEIEGPALHGLVGEFVDRIEQHTEAAPAALLVQFLVCFGSAVGRSAHTIVEEDRHFPNLFAILVGPSAVGRKGSSAGRILSAFESLEPEDWSGDRVIKGGLSTGEGLIWAVRDPITETKPIREGGQVTGYQEVLTDAGVEDKRLLVFEPEFAKVLRVARRDGNTLSPTIRMAWDSGNLRTLTRSSPAVATDAHISLVGHCTQVELLRNLNETELANGFANRFLWVKVRRVRLLPEGGQPADLSDLVVQLQAAVRFARQTGVVVRDAAASELWCEEYRNLSAGRPGLFGHVTSRAEAQVLRLSLVYALLDRSTVIRRDHVEAAMAFWAYCRESARSIFGDRLGDPLAQKIRTAIETRPGIARSELYDATSRHASQQQLVAALRMLLDAGLARRERRPTGGRPREVWFPTSGPSNESEDHQGVVSLPSPSSPPPDDDPEPTAASTGPAPPDSGHTPRPLRGADGDESREVFEL